MKLTLKAALAFAGTLVFLGCGNDKTIAPACVATIIDTFITPKTATIDHTAVAPANQQIFSAGKVVSFQGSGCRPSTPNPDFQALVDATWVVSDPTKVSVTIIPGQATVVCLTNTTEAVTITATAHSDSDPSQTFTATATLTCQ